MPCVCPVDFRNCPDDMCRGTGICGRNGHELLDRCERCNQPINDFIWCNCEPDDYEGDGDTEIGSGTQLLSDSEPVSAQERSAKQTHSQLVPSLPSADGSIAQMLLVLDECVRRYGVACEARHPEPSVDAAFAAYLVNRDALILLCQSEAKQEIERVQAIQETLAKHAEGLIGYVVDNGSLHEDDCPCDDTCDCSEKPKNDAANAICKLAESSLALLQEQRTTQIQEQKEHLGALCATEGDAHPRSVHAPELSHDATTTTQPLGEGTRVCVNHEGFSGFTEDCPTCERARSRSGMSARDWLDFCIGRLMDAKDAPVAERAAKHDAVTEAVDALIADVEAPLRYRCDWLQGVYSRELERQTVMTQNIITAARKPVFTDDAVPDSPLDVNERLSSIRENAEAWPVLLPSQRWAIMGAIRLLESGAQEAT